MVILFEKNVVFSLADIGPVFSARWWINGIVNYGRANSTVESTKREFSRFHWSLKSSCYCAHRRTYDSCSVEHTEVECILLNKNCTCDCVHSRCYFLAISKIALQVIKKNPKKYIITRYTWSLIRYTWIYL